MVASAQITVIVLTCNRSGFIRYALEGLYSQTFTDWKLLASDCSDDPRLRDEVAQITAGFAGRKLFHYPVILQQTEKVSQAEHLRRALAQVDTPLVALLDDDDVWLPGHLERSVAWLKESPRRGLAISQFRGIDGHGHEDKSDHLPSDAPASNDRRAWLGLELRSYYGSTSSFVFRREALAGHEFFPTSLVDNHLALTVLLNGYEVVGFSEPTLLYRSHPGSSYQKGKQVVIDRHHFRLWLFRRQGWRVTRQYPLFPLLVFKSAVELLMNRS